MLRNEALQCNSVGVVSMALYSYLSFPTLWLAARPMVLQHSAGLLAAPAARRSELFPK